MDFDEIFYNLIEKMKSYHPSDNFEIIEKAFHFAEDAHKSQLRKSGEPYIIHPLSVALLLADLELDKETIAAGILHDVIEDTKYTYDDICKIFSDEIGLLVDGVTKLDKLSYSSKEEAKAENYRKMFLAMAKDIRVIIIKLVDRLHNLRTLNHMPKRKQKEIAQETLDIYAPLARKLGIYKIQVELEDLSLKYLNPEVYYELASKIEKKQSERLEYVNTIVEMIREEMENNAIEAHVDGRPKHFFSIYKKMVGQGKSFDEIYDLFAVRAIVDTVQDCYSALGIVDGLFKPVPGRFKNYIAVPKPNNYQSLHDTLLGPEGEPFEIQIRTWQMHRTCEYGIAAHWRYKSGKPGEKTDDKEEAKLSWLREILDWQRDVSDSKEYMESLKTDLDVYNDQVYAFSPKGDVINIPKGSTPIDFAYMIHSAIGNKMVGARVDNKIVPFEYEIKNGERVEILTSQNSTGPSRDWLKIAKSSQAKSRINAWFKSEFKEENIIRGKDFLEKDAKKKGYTLSELLRPAWVKLALSKFGFQNWDAACAAVGHGGLREGQLLNKLIEEFEKEKEKDLTTEDILKRIEEKTPPSKRATTSGVIVKGVGEVSVRFSKCCSPVPGDEIVGFVTKGRGLSVHRTDCINVINSTYEERKRMVDTEWQIKDNKNINFAAEFKIISEDRNGMLMDITKMFNELQISLQQLHVTKSKNGGAIFDVTIEVSSKGQLDKVFKRILNIRGVHDVIRTSC